MKKRELLVRADRSLEILWPARVVALALLLVVVLSAAIAPRAALGGVSVDWPSAAPVSYTHLDVYKRQGSAWRGPM